MLEIHASCHICDISKRCIPLLRPRRFLSICGTLHLPAYAQQGYGGGQPSGSSLHVPTVVGELQSAPMSSDSAVAVPARDRNVGDDRATAAVRSGGNDDFAPSAPEEALMDEVGD